MRGRGQKVLEEEIRWMLEDEMRWVLEDGARRPEGTEKVLSNIF